MLVMSVIRPNWVLVCHGGVVTGHSTALSVGRTQHLGAAALLRYGRDPDSAGGNEDGSNRRLRARGDGENSAREIAHGSVGVRGSGGREGESGWFSGFSLGEGVAG